MPGAVSTAVFLTGESQMARRMRQHDWGSFGKPETWPAELKTIISLILASDQPMFVAWGAQQVWFYNDAFIPILGRKHPAALGRPALDEVWAEARSDLAPLFSKVASGQAVRMDDFAIGLDRQGKVEEAHFAFSYTPITDVDGQVRGLFGVCTETTDRVAAERVRQESRREEDRLRLAITAAQIGTWDFNPVTGDLKWDDRCKALFGLSPSAEVTYDGTFLAGLHPDDRERTDKAVQASLDPGAPSSYDIEYRTIGLEDGVERWVAATGDALFEGDRAIRFIGTVRDISDRKRSDRLFDILNTTAATVAADLDVDRIVQTITDAGVAMTGAQFGAFFYNVQDEKGEWYTLYALSGAPREAFAKFPMPRNTAVFEPTFSGQGVVRSDNIRRDERYGRSAPYHGMPPGHLPVCSYLAVPVTSRSGEVLGGLFFGHEGEARFSEEHEELLIGVAAHAATAIDNARLYRAAQIEIAERRRAEEALTANAARLTFLDTLGKATAKEQESDRILAITTRMLGEHLGVDICAYADMEPDQDAFTIRGDWSREGVPSIVGTYSLATFGYKAVADLHAGRPLILNDNIAEIGADQAAMFLQIGIRATICMPFVKQEVLTALMAIHTATPHQWTSDELALLSEVTERSWAHIERVRAVAALRELNATLEQRVAEAVAERARAEELLHQAQKMEAIGQLTGGIAHDFNNMLSVVVGGLQLTRRRLSAGDTDVDKFITGAMEGATRAAALTQRLLAFSRRQPLAPESVNVNRLVETMTDLLSRTLGETITVETQLGSDVWMTFVDPIQLESSILNLCVNSRDAMPAGGKLSIATENVVVTAPRDGMSEGEYVMIAVADTGEGMTPDVQAKAFDPFFTTKEIGKGSGLGLSQVFGFVRQSGGHVGIVSSPGEGTVVSIYLPRWRKGETTASKLDPAARDARGSGETVLVVEDDERVRTFSTAALREIGYKVETAENGAAALAVLETGRQIDLLFTDVVMPGMTGHQLATVAKGMRPDLKVLYTTGYAPESALSPGMLEDGGSFLQKPFDLDQLAMKVRMALDGA